MECNDNSCAIKSDNQSEVTLIDNQIGDEELNLRVKGKVLFEKLGIKEVYELVKVGQEDNYAEPIFEQKLVDFTPKTKYFGIYMTASWCTPCHKFYPSLSKFEEEHKDEFSYIVISCDTLRKQFIDYAKNKDWKFLDIEDLETRSNITKRFGIGLLPSMTIVNVETRKLVTTWGREAIQYNGNSCKEDWDQGSEGFLWWHFFRFW
ncbi:hypothetical protein K502DRAFT_323724 [Neoconidiobolus thromboides FSU 785]|nr:hypothetical protein K502DRAFT_323724 [Neoconidiobolus thromboides FSU 785]